MGEHTPTWAQLQQKAIQLVASRPCPSEYEGDWNAYQGSHNAWWAEVNRWATELGRRSYALVMLIEATKSWTTIIQKQRRRLSRRIGWQKEQYHALREELLDEMLKYQAMTGDSRLLLPDGTGIELRSYEHERVEVIDIDQVPREFCRVEADKVAIKAAIKAGLEVEGVALVPMRYQKAYVVKPGSAKDRLLAYQQQDMAKEDWHGE